MGSPQSGGSAAGSASWPLRAALTKRTRCPPGVPLPFTRLGLGRHRRQQRCVEAAPVSDSSHHSANDRSEHLEDK